MKKFIGFVGLSHLGLVTSIAFSLKKINVVAYDENLKNVFKKNKIIIKEPGLQKSIDKNKFIKFTDDFNFLIKCNIIYISFDIPTDSNGIGDYSIVNKTLKKLNKYLPKNKIIVIHSQIYPGYIRNLKLKFKNVYYHVETLIFGKALRRALNPERIIIGKENKFKKINNDFLELLKKFDSPIIEMTYESAELCKISINMMLISSIMTSNLLSRVSENTMADWQDIIQALKLDKRIGKFAYLYPNLGLSGGNLERDLKVIEKYLDNKAHLNFVKSLQNVSNQQINIIFNYIENYLKKNQKIKLGLLGLTYKENTNSIKNSPSIKLINKFSDRDIIFYDPVVKNYKNFISELSMKDLINHSDILIIMTAWKEFKKIDQPYLNKNFSGNCIIDPFRVAKINYTRKHKFSYFTLGKKL